MSCDRWTGMLIDRMADELGEEDAILLEQHLAECSTCSEQDASLRQLYAATGLRVEIDPDHALAERLVGEMRRLRSPAAPRSAIRRLVRRLAVPLPAYVAVAVVLIAVACGFWVGRFGRPEPHASRPEIPTATTPAGGSDLVLGTPGFVTVQADAIRLAPSAPGDSL